MSKQKIFKFNFIERNNNQVFYINETNEKAYDGLIKNNLKNIILFGPKKSGKTFLSQIWKEKNKAIIYNKNFEFIINNYYNVIIDQKIKLSEEEKVFHIINHCNAYNLKLLIISENKLNDLKIRLKDLNSRLKLFSTFEILDPNDDMLRNILIKLFEEKQFIINSQDIFTFIIRRANRSYYDMLKIVDKLDKLSLEKKRQLTIPLIKEIL